MVDKNNPQIDNEYIRDLLSSYLDDEVSDAERLMVERAVAESDELQAELDSLRQTVTLLNNLPPMPAPRPFTLSQIDVEPVLSPAQPAKKRNWFGWWLGGFSAAAAAVLCVVVGWGLFSLGNQSSSEIALAPDVDNAPQQQVEMAAEAADEPAEEPMALEVAPTMTIPIAEEAQAAELAEPEAEAEVLEAETGLADEAAEESLFSTELAGVPESEPAQEGAAESQLNEIPVTSTPSLAIAEPTPSPLDQARVAPSVGADTEEEAQEPIEAAPPVEPETETAELAMEEEEASEESIVVESDLAGAEDGSTGEDEVAMAEELPAAKSEPAAAEEAVVDEDAAVQPEASGIGGSLPETDQTDVAASEAEATTEPAQDQVVSNEETATEEATEMVTETDMADDADDVLEEEAEEAEALDEETMLELPQEQSALAGDSEATQSTVAPAEEAPITEPQAPPPAPEQPESLPQQPAAEESSAELMTEGTDSMDESVDQPQAVPQTENIPTETPSPLPSPEVIVQATATVVSAATPTQVTQATPEPPSEEQPIPSNVLPWLFGLVLVLLAMLTVIVLLIILRLNRQS